MLRLSSWNVNSLTVRFEHIWNWLDVSNSDILAIQETKLSDEKFPLAACTERGYQVVYAGQKSYNGVAILSRFPLTDITHSVPGFEDPQRRILAATIGDLRLINLYVPNGSTVGSEKYLYKLEWLAKINEFIQQQLQLYEKVAVVGDFNIAPEDCDVHDPKAWENCVMASPQEREAFSKLLALGLVDSFRHCAQDTTAFTWWDYRAGSFRRNLGLRIDHILLNQRLLQCCRESQIDISPRKWQRPSDHAPIWVDLDV